MKRVEVYSVKDGKAALGVFVDDIEIACPVIQIDSDGYLCDWTDGDLNYAVALEKGMTADDVSKIIEIHDDDIRQQIIDKTKD